jgi:hypothetical protein
LKRQYCRQDARQNAHASPWLFAKEKVGFLGVRFWWERAGISSPKERGIDRWAHCFLCEGDWCGDGCRKSGVTIVRGFRETDVRPLVSSTSELLGNWGWWVNLAYLVIVAHRSRRTLAQAPPEGRSSSRHASSSFHPFHSIVTPRKPMRS